MKDIIVRVMRVLVGGALVAYVSWLFINGLSVSLLNSDYFLIFIGVLGAFMVIMGLFGLCIPKARIIQCLLGLFLILFGNYALIDDPSKNVYLADIIKILGVFLTIAGPLGLCVTSKCQKKVEESKIIEIIEV